MHVRRGEENTLPAIVADHDVAGGFTPEALAEDDAVGA
jgi:hypothetical protein